MSERRWPARSQGTATTRAAARGATNPTRNEVKVIPNAKRPTASDYQNELVRGLAALFTTAPVQKEWAALSGEAGRYSPRLDVAVGPFAFGSVRHGEEFDRMSQERRGFLEQLHAAHSRNVSQLDPEDRGTPLDVACRKNPNARCFLAIEVEWSGSRKHLLGGAVNAAALGRLGLSVAGDEDLLRALLKMRRYLLFLGGVGKNSFDPSNLMVLSAKQLSEALGR